MLARGTSVMDAETGLLFEVMVIVLRKMAW